MQVILVNFVNYETGKRSRVKFLTSSNHLASCFLGLEVVERMKQTAHKSNNIDIYLYAYE